MVYITLILVLTLDIFNPYNQSIANIYPFQLSTTWTKCAGRSASPARSPPVLLISPRRHVHRTVLTGGWIPVCPSCRSWTACAVAPVTKRLSVLCSRFLPLLFLIVVCMDACLWISITVHKDWLGWSTSCPNFAPWMAVGRFIRGLWMDRRSVEPSLVY